MIYDEREEDTDLGIPAGEVMNEAEDDEDETLGGGTETPEEEEAYE